MVQLHTRYPREGVVLVDVTGEIDVVTASEFQYSLLRRMEEGNSNLILNFEKLEFIDSSGIRAIMAAYLKGKENDIELSVATPHLYHEKIFRLTGLSEKIKVYQSAVDALRSMGNRTVPRERELQETFYRDWHSDGIVVPVACSQERLLSGYESYSSYGDRIRT